jgi:hypothetical protein
MQGQRGERIRVRNLYPDLFPYGLWYRKDISFFAQVTDDLEAIVFKMLVEIADHGEAYEVKNGRDDWI